MAKSSLGFELMPYDEILTATTTDIKNIALTDLEPFEEQPFKVLMDESMTELAESIKEYGVLSPIIVRPKENGKYEILSGHRRAKACELAGLEAALVLVKELNDDEAAILLVDSNLQRENILPSEKAFAYHLKLEAMKHQGKTTSSQIGTKLRSDDELAFQTGESRNQIQRYIRLTNLITPILDMVDEKKIALNAAVELSYLGSKEQSDVLKSIEQEQVAPSIAQAAKIRRFSEEGKLTAEVITSIMQEHKPEKFKITFKSNELKKYFPQGYTQRQIEDTILKLVSKWARKREEQER